MHSRCLRLIMLAALIPTAGVAQAPSRWTLTVGLDGHRFGAIAQDTTGLAAAAPDLRPAARMGFGAALRRQAGPWQVAFALGWAGGHAEAANDVAAVRDRTANLDRYRAALFLGRRLAGVGSGQLSLELGPVFDLWAVEDETRTRAGVESAAVLTVPLGGLALEHRLAVGLSASPVEQEDVGTDFDMRPLWALAFGVGVRVPL